LLRRLHLHSLMFPMFPVALHSASKRRLMVALEVLEAELVVALELILVLVLELELEMELELGLILVLVLELERVLVQA